MEEKPEESKEDEPVGSEVVGAGSELDISAIEHVNAQQNKELIGDEINDDEWDDPSASYIDSGVYVDGFGNEFMDESMKFIFQDGDTPEPDDDEDFDPKDPQVWFF